MLWCLFWEGKGIRGCVFLGLALSRRGEQCKGAQELAEALEKLPPLVPFPSQFSDRFRSQLSPLAVDDRLGSGPGTPGPLVILPGAVLAGSLAQAL